MRMIFIVVRTLKLDPKEDLPHHIYKRCKGDTITAKTENRYLTAAKRLLNRHMCFWG